MYIYFKYFKNSNINIFFNSKYMYIIRKRIGTIYFISIMVVVFKEGIRFGDGG